MSRSKIDPATRDGEIDGLLRQLRRVLERGVKSRDGGLLPLVSMVIRIRERARAENRSIDWRYADDASMGFDRTPCMFLGPEKVTLEAFIERLSAEGPPLCLERRARGA